LVNGLQVFHPAERSEIRSGEGLRKMPGNFLAVAGQAGIVVARFVADQTVKSRFSTSRESRFRLPKPAGRATEKNLPSASVPQ